MKTLARVASIMKNRKGGSISKSVDTKRRGDRRGEERERERVVFESRDAIEVKR